MTDNPAEDPDTSVPALAVRLVQGLVVLCELMLLLLIPILVLLIVTGKKPHKPEYPTLTIAACVFAGVCLAFKYGVLPFLSNLFAWLGQPPETRELSRFKRGSHYACGSVLHQLCYFFPAEFGWIVFYLDRSPLAAVIGIVFMVLMLVEFPTAARAKEWGERYFRRPDAILPA